MNRCFELRHCVPMQHQPQWRGATEVLAGEMILYIESGSIEAELGGRTYHLRQGSACWIPDGTHRHLRVNEAETTTRDWRLRFTRLKNVKAITLPKAPIIKHRGAELLPYLQLLNALSRQPHINWQDEASAVIESACIRFNNLPDHTSSRLNQINKLNEHQKQQLNRFLDDKLFTNASPADMADALRLSHDYFTRIFKQTYGVPPRSYLRDEKMRRAGDILMETNLSLKELCRSINEPDQGTFCRQFKKVHGCTPTQYRERQRRPRVDFKVDSDGE